MKDKLLDHEDFTETDPNTTQLEEEKMVSLLDGSGYAIIVNEVVQKRKNMLVNKAKKEVGMAKWSKKYDVKLEDG